MQRKFLNYAVRVPHIHQRPYDYELVFTELRLSNISDRYVSANWVLIRKNH